MPFEQANKSEESDAISLLKERLSGFETEKGRLKGLHYIPCPRDVCITTTPKAGTTWLQQICHQLRAKEGDMDFDEISRVVPWLELAHDQGQDLKAPQWRGDDGQQLRFFKTHAWAGHCPKFPKTIVVVRDPCDVLLSFYNFFEGWFFEPGTISLEAFAEEFWLQRGIPESKMQNASYFVHLTSWYQKYQEGKQNGKNDILMICFEDLKEDLKSQIQGIAQFLSDLDARYVQEPQRVEIALSHSSYDFMKKHSGHFDEKISKIARNEACGLPKDAGMRSSKVGGGLSGLGKVVLSEELHTLIEVKWKDQVFPVTACSSYGDFRAHLAREAAATRTEN
mmetsp:Transcript_24113/g.66832  ORF Transcript_24113/g.66832 Transcript_24113/m.66832 type:complete len:337 (-) Transcript_24113:22-1032(-)